MFNFTPPSRQNVLNGILGAAITLILLVSYYAGFRAGNTEFLNDCYTIKYDPAIFHSRDSLLYYARLAYLEEDPDALGITGTAAFLFMDDPAAQDTLPLVTPDEGAILLLRASELGSPRARFVIECLNYWHVWQHSISE